MVPEWGGGWGVVWAIHPPLCERHRGGEREEGRGVSVRDV